MIVAKKEKQATGDKTTAENLLFPYAWYLKKQGYAKSTIKSRVSIFKVLVKRGAVLSDPESVKGAIASQDWVNKRKMNAVDAYTIYLKMNGLTWDPPRYSAVEKFPFIPKETELDDLIAGCGPKTSTFLRLLKETGMRSGEAQQLRWDYIDFETGTVRVIPEKRSNPRIFRISNELLNMLAAVKRNNRVHDPCRIFGKNLKSVRRVYSKQRDNLARKLQNPRLKRIHFHTFRHWKGTMLYHNTKDVLFVQRFLGHRSLRNTLRYIQLEEAIFKDLEDEYICKAADTVEEARDLIELGFSYVCEMDGVRLFRKTKHSV